MDALAPRQCAADPALPHLRLGRRRQVDADRPAALRAEAHLRRSALGARARLQEARHHRRRHRFRAAGRRPRGRARAGHHDRRRLSLFRDAEALVHRRRHARPRAIYPQHGDRRLERRSRDPADRRAQGPADADAPPRDDRLAARHPPRRAGGQQDRPRRFRRSDVSTKSSRLSRPSPSRSVSARSSPIPISARFGDNVSSPSARTPWYSGPTLLDYLESIDVEEDRAQAPFRLPVQWVNRPEPRFPRLCRHDRERRAPRAATRSSSRLPAARRRCASLYRADRAGRRRRARATP